METMDRQKIIARRGRRRARILKEISLGNDWEEARGDRGAGQGPRGGQRNPRGVMRIRAIMSRIL